MMGGRRKSIQAMASRLPDGNEQNLQQFVNQSTWDPVAVRRRIAERMVPQVGPVAWAVDDVSFPKDGRMSVGGRSPVLRCAGQAGQLPGRSQCARGLRYGLVPAELAAVPPQEWADDAVRRRQTGVPEGIGHREKWRPAVDALDELAEWGLVPPVVVADAGYGQNAGFRAALAERGVSYVVGIRGDITVQPHDAVPAAPDWSGNGRRPVPRYRQPPVTVADLATAAGREAFGEVTWREGSRGPMTSRFLSVKVRPAGVRSRRPAQQAAVAGHGRWGGVLPPARLLAEWPDGEHTPTRFWLSNLPDDTPIADMVRLVKIRWRIEHDYRELKHGLGLDHFEGRSWNGWHHHATLVTAAHAFLTERRLAPKADTPDSPSTSSSTPSRAC
jgi:SRSO17 transposase